MIDGVKCPSEDLNCGVPRGSVLGPILYFYYMLHLLAISLEDTVLTFIFRKMTHNYCCLKLSTAETSRALKMCVKDMIFEWLKVN